MNASGVTSAGLVLGLGVGIGLWVALRGLFPAPASLQRIVSDLQRGPGPRAGSAGMGAGAGERIGLHLLALLEGGPQDPARRASDLRVTAKSAARHAFDKLLLALVFAALPALSALGLGAAAVTFPLALVVPLSGLLAVAGFVVPDASLRSEAAARRRECRFALSSYLELVVVILAAGGGVETAVYDAAGIGAGWVYEELGRTLEVARITGDAPWDALDRLGMELGVTQLRQVAASMQLAGHHGARVRQSLAEQAVSLREEQLDEIETQAQEATEKMGAPVASLLFGFVLFIGYPAVSQILNGL